MSRVQLALNVDDLDEAVAFYSKLFDAEPAKLKDGYANFASLSGEGLFTDEEIGTTCCFATQDKVWVTGPAGEKWEVYTVLADSETFGASPQQPGSDAEGPACCGGTQSAAQGSCC